MFFFHRCDVTVMNSIGQTAKDIAEFWLHDDIVNEFSQATLPNNSGSFIPPPQVANYFCESPLNRMSQLRNDVTWITDLARASTTVYIMFADLNVLAQPYVRSASHRPARCTYEQLKPYLEADHKPTVVFLGVDDSSSSEGQQRNGWFAVDVSSLSTEEIDKLCPHAERLSIHPRMLQMPRTEAAIVGHARSMLAWLDRYQFCPTCGSTTDIRDAGYKRVCVKDDCRSKAGW